MASLERLGIIIKIIAKQPGIKLAALREKLSEAGINVSEKTITTDIECLKRDLKLLDNKRLRQGYFLSEITTVGDAEVDTVVDALFSFGMNLRDMNALEIGKRLGPQRAGIRTTGLRQRNIYKEDDADVPISTVLKRAIRQSCAIELTLETPRSDKIVVIRCYPLYRVFHERGWYLITKDLSHERYNTCRVDRIRSCKLLEDQESNNDMETDVNRAQFLISMGWGMDFPRSTQELDDQENQEELVVRFDRSIAAFIREGINRHPKAIIAPAPDGSGCIDFRIRLKYQSEFKTWVKSWGSKAWFLQPPSAVEEQIADIRRQLMNYGI